MMCESASKKRILILTPQFPYPPHQGTTIRNYNLIVHLARRHEVHLLSFGDPTESRITPLHDCCRSVQVIPPPRRSVGRRLKGLLFSRLPDMAQRLPSAKFRAALDATLDQIDPDVLEVEGIELAQYLFQAAARRAGTRRPLLVFDDHNAEYVLQQRAFETDSSQLLAWGRGVVRRWVGAVYSFVQWQRLRGYERRACLAADRVIAVSERDGRALCRLVPGLTPQLVPNGVDMAFYTASTTVSTELAPEKGRFSPMPSGPSLVFTGKMDFRPNVDAVLWFSQEVLPFIRRKVPDAHFWVVGKDPHPRLAPLISDPGVTVTGAVEDIRPYIAGAAIYVVPLRIGGGTRLKVLEAMAMGKAIVSTSLGCEGFDLVADQQLIIADTPADLAAAAEALFHDPELRQRLGTAARCFAAANYDWSNIVPRLEKAYSD